MKCRKINTISKPLLLFLLLPFGVATVLGQETYTTTNGEITFNASTPLENINPTNGKVNGILKDDGAFGAVMLIRDFEFSNKLMQEHFNENYMESDKYPKAYFSGQIENLIIEEITNLPKEYHLNGKITVHNVTRKLKTTIYLNKGDNGIKATSNFKLFTKDFNIKIPKIVFKKIAEEVDVEVNFSLNPLSPISPKR